MKRIIAIFAIMMAGYPVRAQSDSSHRSQKSLDEIQLDAVKRLHDQPVTDDGIGKQRTMPTPEQQATDQSKEQITSKAKEQVTTDQLTMINSRDGMNRSQSYEGYRSPYFTFSNVGVPKDVDKLGTNPEFPFLQHKTSAAQVYQAIKTKAGRDDHQMSEFNNILTAIGFANGAKDVRMGDVTAANIPNGTLGNMGDGSYNSTYSKLNLGDEGVKAWKVTGSSGYVYFLAKCGQDKKMKL